MPRRAAERAQRAPSDGAADLTVQTHTSPDPNRADRGFLYVASLVGHRSSRLEAGMGHRGWGLAQRHAVRRDRLRQSRCPPWRLFGLLTQTEGARY